MSPSIILLEAPSTCRSDLPGPAVTRRHRHLVLSSNTQWHGSVAESRHSIPDSDHYNTTSNAATLMNPHWMATVQPRPDWNSSDNHSRRLFYPSHYGILPCHQPLVRLRTHPPLRAELSQERRLFMWYPFSNLRIIVIRLSLSLCTTPWAWNTAFIDWGRVVAPTSQTTSGPTNCCSN
jgi:hypothetical protein